MLVLYLHHLVCVPDVAVGQRHFVLTLFATQQKYRLTVIIA